MVNPKLYKGIEYVHLDDLPVEQREVISETLNKDLFIKILIDGRLFPQCILFKDYSYWFKQVYLALQNDRERTGKPSVNMGI